MKSDAVPEFIDRNYDYLVIHDRFVRDYQRIGDKHPKYSYRFIGQWFHDHPGYELVKTFKADVSIAGINFQNRFDSIDYLITQPTLYIFRKI